MMANTHFQLNREVKIDGVDFPAGIYSADEIDAGRHSSIINAGWGEYCDAPKSRGKTTDDDDDDSAETDSLDDAKSDAKPTKPARSRAKPK